MQTILAITHPGREYSYKLFTAHSVPKSSANRIRDALNAARFRLKDGEIWHVYELSKWDLCHMTPPSFRINRGRIQEVN